MLRSHTMGGMQAAAAAVRLGLCEGDVAVAMPGGELAIGVGAGFEVTLLGPVAKVAEGIVAAEFLDGVGSPAGPGSLA